MKSIVVLSVLLVATPAWAQSDLAADFEAATERALAGDDKGAIALYESLVKRGGAHVDIYFNLGNVYARSGRQLDAVVAYEHALRLDPSDRAVRKNLSTVRAALLGADETVDVPEELGVADVVDPLVAPFPRAPVAYGFLAMNALLVLFVMLRRRPLVIASALLAAILGLVTLGQAVVAHDPRAVIIETVDLRRGPNEKYEPRGEARAGARVRVVDETAGWLQIQNPDGTSGWMLAKRLERI